MKSKAYALLITSLALIAFLGYIVVNGLPLGQTAEGQPRAFLPAKQAIRYGLDLRGGVTVTYEPEKGITPTSEELDTVKAIMRRRLSNKGYFDANVTTSQSKRVIVEIPDIKDPQKAVEELGKTALLQYIIPTEENALEDDGLLTEDEGEVVLSGNDIESVQATLEPKEGWMIQFQITDEARKKFASATEKLAPPPGATPTGVIAITLDGAIISTPVVNSKIDSNTATITGGFTEEAARELASLIKSGALPFKLKVVSTEYVGALLGENALDISIIAGLIGLVMVMIYMILLYRVPGISAALALFAYILTVLFIFARTKITLTLPGIAGIILSIGMAVDANVIIFERLKEEMREGKTIKAAISAAFQRGWPAIRDANITTIISSAVLYYVGTGPIKGFALTLMIGIIVSMLSAILLTRFIVAQFYNIGITKRTLYGVKEEKA